jgi:hypothetical protein
MTLPPMPGHLWFHVVAAGRVGVNADDAEPAWLDSDDVAVMARRTGPDRYELLRHGDGVGALCNPQVGAALATFHRDPARPWTVATMAREAAMSRSVFAARLTELVRIRRCSTSRAGAYSSPTTSSPPATRPSQNPPHASTAPICCSGTGASASSHDDGCVGR